MMLRGLQTFLPIISVLKYKLLFLCFLALTSSFSHGLNLKEVNFVGFKTYEEFSIGRQQIVDSISQWDKTSKDKSLSSLAKHLTQFYRNQGLSFHRVLSGDSSLTLVAGKILRVNASDPSWQPVIEAQLGHLVNRVIYEPNTQAAMLALNDWPGLSIFSFYSVADSNGGMNLNVQIIDSKRLGGKYSLGKYGNSNSGEYLWRTQAFFQSIGHQPNRFSLTAAGTNVSGNLQISAGLDWRTSNKNRLYSQFSWQQLSLKDSLSVLNISGNLLNAQFTNTYQFKRSFLDNRYHQFGINSQYSDLTSDAGLLSLNESFYRVAGRYQYQQRKIGSTQTYINQLDAGVNVVGIFDYQGQQPIDDVYAVGNFSYQWRASLFGLIQQKFDWGLKLDTQISPTNVAAGDKMSLSGPNAASAWQSGILSANNGALVKFYVDGFQSATFKIPVNIIYATDGQNSLSNVDLGIQWQLNKMAKFELRYALPLSASEQFETQSQLWGGISGEF